MYGFNLNKEAKIQEYYQFYKQKIFPKIKTIPEVTQKDYGYHGLLSHTENVVIRGIFFALAMDKNPYPVIFACAGHDLARVNDRHDELHGPHAVPIISKLMDMFSDLLTEDEKEKVRYAIKNHTIGVLAPDYISACLWDADRCRLAWEGTFHEEYFNTEIGKKIASNDVHQFAGYIDECLGNDYNANLVVHDIEDLRINFNYKLNDYESEDYDWLGPRASKFDDYYLFLNSYDIFIFKTKEDRDSYYEDKSIKPYKVINTFSKTSKDGHFWESGIFEDNNKTYYFAIANNENGQDLFKAEIIKADFIDYIGKKMLNDEDDEKCYKICMGKKRGLEVGQF